MLSLSDVQALFSRAATADLTPATPRPDRVERDATILLQRLGYAVEVKVFTSDDGSTFVVIPFVLDLLSIPGEPTTDTQAALEDFFQQCASPKSPEVTKLVSKLKASLISTKRGRPPLTHEITSSDLGSVRGARTATESEDLKPVKVRLFDIQCIPELHFGTAELNGERLRFSISDRDAPEGDLRKFAGHFLPKAPNGMDVVLYYRSKGEPYVLVSDLVQALSAVEEDDGTV